MCIKSTGIAGIAENLPAEYLQKICRCYRKCAENLQVLQNICRKSAGITENVQKICRYLQKWFPKGGLLVLDDLMAEGGEDKELLDLFTKHSHHPNITVLYLCQDMFPPGKYAKSISRNAHSIVAFKNPRDQLGMKNLLLQAFPTCWQDMMDVYQKVTERPFRYTVLDLHPASDDSKRVFSHLLTHERYPRWHRRIRKECV